MRILLYIGFAMPASMFNKHNKDDNSFWYPDHHSEEATFNTVSLWIPFDFPLKQVTEFRFTNLSLISPDSWMN